MRATFNAPPGWPVPEQGWLPEPGWQPDPAWPAPPPGWLFLLPDARESLVHALRSRSAALLVVGTALLGLAAALAAATSLVWGWDVAEVGVVGALGVVGVLQTAYAAAALLSADRRAGRLLERRQCVVVPLTSSSGRPPR